VFSIGFLELMMIAVVALLVLGPDRLPGAVREAAMWVGRIRHQANALRRELEDQIDEIENESVIAELKKGRKFLDDVQCELNRDIAAVVGRNEAGRPEDRKT